MPPELSAWQIQVLDAIAASKLAEDLDFLLPRELEDGELRPLTRSLVAEGVQIDEQQAGPRRSLLLLRSKREIGRVDFAFYPYDPIGRRERWRGLVVESLLDMTVNKTQALITRFRPRDFVDFSISSRFLKRRLAISHDEDDESR